VKRSRGDSILHFGDLAIENWIEVGNQKDERRLGTDNKRSIELEKVGKSGKYKETAPQDHNRHPLLLSVTGSQ
jgi:hypothetical protein